jgi:ELWxxDGT repeat protein
MRRFSPAWLVLVVALLVSIVVPVDAAAASRHDSGPTSVWGLTRIGKRVLFLAREFQRDTVLWSTDGTPGRTRLVRRLASFGFGGTIVAARTYALIYVPSDHGRELWRSDGTPRGTTRIAGGSVPAIEYTFTRAGRRVFWIGPEYPGGSTQFDAYLWTSDGTRAGTHRLAMLESSKIGFKDFYEGYQLVPYRGSMYIKTRSGGIWRSDGSEARTVLLAETGARVLSFMTAGGQLFARELDSHGVALWAIDGAEAGARRLATTACGDDCDYNAPLAVTSGRIVFAGDDGQHGEELWITDGTQARTRMLVDICPGPCGSEPYYFMAKSGGKVFFGAADARHGRELWATDGTAAGTRLVRDICRGKCGSFPYPATSRGRIYFGAHDRKHGQELWSTDGTSEGTRLVGDICRGKCNSYPDRLTVMRSGRVYLSAKDLRQGTEPWTRAGGSHGTRLLRDICAGRCSSSPYRFVSVRKGLVAFLASDGRSSRVWVTSEVIGDTRPLSTGGVYWEGGEPIRLAGSLVFSSGGNTVWKTDGTNRGTVRLTPH